MDINLIRSLVTVMGLILFLAVVRWTYQSARLKAFEEAAALPFADEAEPSISTSISTGDPR